MLHEGEDRNLLAGADVNGEIVENKIKSGTIARCVVVESHVTS